MNHKIKSLFYSGLALPMLLLPSIAFGQVKETLEVAKQLGTFLTSPTLWVSYLIYGISYLLFSIAGYALQFSGFLLELTITINTAVLTNSFVLQGWVAVRDLANLGIVFAIIMIAVMTILGREEYGLRSYLTTLIVMALVINFTFVIAGIFLDASGIFTNFFLNKITAGDGTAKLSTHIAASLGISNFSNLLPQDFSISQHADSNKMLSLSVYLIVISAFLIGSAIVISIIGVMLLIRFLVLSVLLIIAPLAWILYAFPGMNGYTKRWWDTFFQWTFFLPITLFFIYLALFAILDFSANQTFLFDAIGQIATGEFTGGLTQLLNSFSQLIIGIALLLAAVFVGQAAGGAGGSLMFTLADRARRGALGLATGTAGLTGRYAMRKFMTAQDASGKTRSDRWQNTAARFGLVGVANAIGGMTRGYEHDATEYQKNNLSNLSPDALLGLAKRMSSRASFTTDVERAAMASELAKRKLYGKLGDSEQERTDMTHVYLDAAEKIGTGHEVLKSRPDLAHTPDEALKSFNKLSVDEQANLSADVYKGESEASQSILLNLRTGALRRMGALGNDSQQDMVVTWLTKEHAALKALSASDRARAENVRRIKQYDALASQIKSDSTGAWDTYKARVHVLPATTGGAAPPTPPAGAPPAGAPPAGAPPAGAGGGPTP